MWGQIEYEMSFRQTPLLDALHNLAWAQKLSGHNLRDRSECVNMIGVISEPFMCTEEVNHLPPLSQICSSVCCQWSTPVLVVANRHVNGGAFA